MPTIINLDTFCYVDIRFVINNMFGAIIGTLLLGSSEKEAHSYSPSAYISSYSSWSWHTYTHVTL